MWTKKGGEMHLFQIIADKLTNPHPTPRCQAIVFQACADYELTNGVLAL